jgi:hypothetical protein
VSLEALRSFVANAPVTDRCGLCAAPVGEPHPHLFDREQQRLECACPQCALLFDRGGARWAKVPHKVERLAQNPLSDASWESLGLPIGLAFFIRSSKDGLTAWYPGPAGAMRCQLKLEPPELSLEADVEALLVNRLEGAGAAYRVSIDECYALVGLIRANWRGFGGGPAVREQVKTFFQKLEAPRA